ncbi:MAG: DUF5686 family protein [Bacteroidales bacterium]|nr:DUF5686 family protein [Bacteroidales bacterium]
MDNKIKFIPLFVFILCLFSSGIEAQTNLIKGVVVDSITAEPVSYVSVYLKGTTIGAMTDDNGNFEIHTTTTKGTLIISCIGYKEYSASLSSFKNIEDVNIKLVPTQYQLAEVLIKPKKEKYSKKNNPAVEFVKNVIDNRNENDPKKTKDYYSYERYEKFSYALNEFDEKKLEKGVMKKFNFISQYIDTSEISGLPILTVSKKEMLEENYYRKSPSDHKKIVTATRREGLDEVISESNLETFFGEVFKEVDIYENNISLFIQRFVSPISSIGPSFYKYYLMDTVMIDGEKCQDLGFVPMNSESFGFTGHLYITLDSTYFIKRAHLNIPKNINLNFVDFMSIDQEFSRTEDNTRILTKDDVIVEFKVTEKSKGIHARRLNTYKKHSFDKPTKDGVFDHPEDSYVEDIARFRDENFWTEHRHTPIQGKENNVKKMLQELREVPLFYWTEKLVSTIIAGYIPTSKDTSLVEIGPMNTMISGNAVEGARMRFGALTTPALNKRWFGGAYLAYGTRDQEFKYQGQLEYSFHDKKEHQNEFPIHSIKAMYTYDVDQLGQQYLFTNKDNIVLSLKRKKDDRTLYQRKAEILYKKEFYSGFSYSLNLRHKNEYGTDYVRFEQVRKDGNVLLKNYQMAEAELKLRYSPNEKFVQMKSRRIPLTMDAPVFYISHTYARKGILGSDYNFNRTEIGFEKRIWLSAFGYFDTYFKAGKIWDAVPFTLLEIPNANLSYTIQPQSYSLMNPVEFINDEYGSWDITYFMNGLIFNRLPVIKFLKWREVASFKGLVGRLSDKNLPTAENNFFVLPEGCGTLSRMPYMEATVGIENIFKLLRVDYVWRLSYRNNPNISHNGVRISMHITF